MNRFDKLLEVCVLVGGLAMVAIGCVVVVCGAAWLIRAMFGG